MTPSDVATYGQGIAAFLATPGLILAGWRWSPVGRRWAQNRKELQSALALMRAVPPDALSPGRPSLPDMVHAIALDVSDMRHAPALNGSFSALVATVHGLEATVHSLDVGVTELRADHAAHLQIHHIPRPRRSEEGQ